MYGVCACAMCSPIKQLWGRRASSPSPRGAAGTVPRPAPSQKGRCEQTRRDAATQGSLKPLKRTCSCLWARLPLGQMERHQRGISNPPYPPEGHAGSSEHAEDALALPSHEDTTVIQTDATTGPSFKVRFVPHLKLASAPGSWGTKEPERPRPQSTHMLGVNRQLRERSPAGLRRTSHRGGGPQSLYHHNHVHHSIPRPSPSRQYESTSPHSLQFTGNRGIESFCDVFKVTTRKH